MNEKEILDIIALGAGTALGFVSTGVACATALIVNTAAVPHSKNAVRFFIARFLYVRFANQTWVQ